VVEGVTEGALIHAPEIIDPQKLTTRLQNCRMPVGSRKMLGPRSDDLLKQAYDAKKALAPGELVIENDG
jgi:hypothetical protein